MKKTATHDTLLFIIDMQDGMWADHGPAPFDLSQFDEGFRDFLHRQKIRQEEKRHEAMHDMVPAIRDFVTATRERASPVWVTSLWEGTGGVMEGLEARRGDLRLQKTTQSAIPENIDTIRGLQDKGYTRAIVIGAFAGLCVMNTAKDLKEAGFDVTVINDLVIDDVKPGNDEALANALYAIEKTGVSTCWLSEFEQAGAKPTRAPSLSLDLNG